MLQVRIVVLLVVLQVASGDLYAAIVAERIDAEDLPAADGLGGQGVRAADVGRDGRIVEIVAELPIEELRLRIALQRPLEPPRQIQIRKCHRLVLLNGRGVEAELRIAEHIGERHLRPPEDVPAARDAHVHRRAAVEEHLVEAPLLDFVFSHHRVLNRRLEIDDRSRRAEIGRRHGLHRLLHIEGMHAVVALVIRDKGQPRLAAGFRQHHRVHDAAERVRILLQLAVFQAQRPEIEDVAVARHVGREGNGGIGGRRRKNQHVLIEKFRAGFILRAERQLRLLA